MAVSDRSDAAPAAAQSAGNLGLDRGVKTAGEMGGKSAGETPSDTPKEFAGETPQKSAGISEEKRGGISTYQQLSGKMPAENARSFSSDLPAEKTAGKTRLSPADFFRFEIEIRGTKKGYSVAIRKRLKYSKSRHSRQVAKAVCPDLTAAQVEAIRNGKVSKSAAQALTSGGINYEYVNLVIGRKGHGVGYRLTDLDAGSRFQVARLERLLVGDDRRRDADTETDGRGAHPGSGDLPAASQPDIETVKPVPYVH